MTKPPGYWTKERLRTEALKYTNRKEFRLGNASAYQRSTATGVHDYVCSHMVEKNKPAGYWTDARVKKEALKYSTKHEFKKHSNSAYHCSRVSGNHDDICSHMIPINRVNGYWNNDRIHKEALKYKYRVDFVKGAVSAYGASLNSGKHEYFCSHMIDKLKDWTDENITAEALKYTTRADFQKHSSSAYQASASSIKHGEFCAHMIYQHEEWTPAKLRNEALKYKTKVAYAKGSASAYGLSRTSGNHDEYCSHMKRGRVGFNPDKPAILYYLKIDTRIRTVFKIGVTNLSIKERYLKYELDMITVLKEWHYFNGADAYRKEREILSLYKSERYVGEQVLPRGGNTELFKSNVLRL